MTNVPANYQPLVQQAATGTGLPFNVVAAQANMESGFNSNAVSPAGAEGWLQFLPSTYDEYAAKAGVPAGTEFNPGDETLVYIQFMDQLLHDEGGSIFKALEAYNAGEGNLAAGAGYASSILNAAGESSSATSPGGSTSNVGTTGAQTASIWNPITGVFGSIVGGSAVGNAIGDAGSTVIADLFNTLLGSFGIKDVKDLFQRLGLILLGVGLIFMGLHMFGQTSSKTVINLTDTGSQPDDATSGKSSNAPKTSKPVSKTASTKAAGAGKAVSGAGAGEAVEAAMAV